MSRMCLAQGGCYQSYLLLGPSYSSQSGGSLLGVPVSHLIKWHLLILTYLRIICISLLSFQM